MTGATTRVAALGNSRTLQTPDHTPLHILEAAVWYRRAAEQGDAGTQVELGSMYGLGRGVPQDYIEAYNWLNLATAYAAVSYNAEKREGFAEARDLSAESLTPEQLAEGQKLAREFFDAHPPE